jgi:hypothetical protein
MALVLAVDKRCLHAALLRLARGATLVEGLDDLKRHAVTRQLFERAGSVVLAGPDQLGSRDLDLFRAC